MANSSNPQRWFTGIISIFFCISAAFAQNSKMKTIEIPKFGLKINLPKETVKQKETDSTVQYFFEIFDTGGKNIGTGVFNAYPYYANWEEESLIKTIRQNIQSAKVGNSCEILSTEKIVRKGFYRLNIIKSIYKFKDKDFTVRREDYVYKGCAGVAHYYFTIPSYNCYVTEYERGLLTHNYFHWYFPTVTDNNLNITFSMPNGVFTSSQRADKKGISLRSCIPDYRSEIDIYKPDVSGTTLSAIAQAHFAKIKKSITGTYNWNTYQPANVKNSYVVQSYNTKINGTEFLVHEYVLQTKGVTLAATVKSTCGDADQCGPHFLPEVEKMLETVTLREPKKVTTDDDLDDYFGF